MWIMLKVNTLLWYNINFSEGKFSIISIELNKRNELKWTMKSYTVLFVKIRKTEMSLKEVIHIIGVI